MDCTSSSSADCGSFTKTAVVVCIVLTVTRPAVTPVARTISATIAVRSWISIRLLVCTSMRRTWTPPKPEDSLLVPLSCHRIADCSACVLIVPPLVLQLT